VLDQRFDFLAAAAEDEGIAALQTQHALAFLGQAHQHEVDFLLRHRMVVALLADIDAVGVAPAHVENRLRDEAVMHDDVGLLHQAQRAEGQQIGIAGAGAHQIHLAAADVVFGTVLDHGVELRFGFDVASGKHHFGDRREEHFFPEGAALFRLDRRAHAVLVARSERAETTVGGGDHGFQPSTQHARQHRRFAAAGNRYHDRRAVDDRRQDKAAQRGLVRHVHRDVARTRRIGNDFCSGRIFLDHDHRILAVQQCGRERIRHPSQMVGMRQAFEALVQFECGDIDTRAGAQQQFGLARGSFAAAHHQTVAVAQVEKNGQVIHGIYSAAAASSPDSAGPSSAE